MMCFPHIAFSPLSVIDNACRICGVSVSAWSPFSVDYSHRLCEIVWRRIVWRQIVYNCLTTSLSQISLSLLYPVATSSYYYLFFTCLQRFRNSGLLVLRQFIANIWQSASHGLRFYFLAEIIRFMSELFSVFLFYYLILCRCFASESCISRWGGHFFGAREIAGRRLP